jgi:hypothetical protein
MFKTALASAAIVAALTLPTHAAPLNAEQIKALAPGTYKVSAGLGLVKLRINMRPGGGLSGVNLKKQKTDTGTWSVQGNQLCIKWNRWLKGKTRCTALSGENGRYSGGGLTITKL